MLSMSSFETSCRPNRCFTTNAESLTSRTSPSSVPPRRNVMTTWSPTLTSATESWGAGAIAVPTIGTQTQASSAIARVQGSFLIGSPTFTVSTGLLPSRETGRPSRFDSCDFRGLPWEPSGLEEWATRSARPGRVSLGHENGGCNLAPGGDRGPEPPCPQALRAPPSAGGGRSLGGAVSCTPETELPETPRDAARTPGHT